MPERAIGVFDSGIGGLTVFKELHRRLPGEALVYLGDTARVPYGTKSAKTVERYALEAAAFLEARQVKVLVCACNTASSVALESLAQRYEQPVIGVIEPGARKAAAVTRSGRIGVIGTEGTVKSGAYSRAIRNLDPGLEVFSSPCPLFVPLVEEGWADHPVAVQIAREYLRGLVERGIDTLVLGCTHYPLLKATLHRVLPAEVNLVDSAEETASTVAQLLAARGLARRSPPAQPRFFVTDLPDRFIRVGSAFLGMELRGVEQVEVD